MKYSIKDVAEAIGTSAETVRAGLIRGCFPFGTAFKKDGSKIYTYVLYPRKVEEYLGLGGDNTDKPDDCNSSERRCRYTVGKDGTVYYKSET